MATRHTGDILNDISHETSELCYQKETEFIRVDRRAAETEEVNHGKFTESMQQVKTIFIISCK